MRKLLPMLAKALFVFAFFIFSNTASAQIFQFTFENTTAPAIDNAVGTPSFAVDGATGATYTTTTPCQGARMYTAANWDTGDSYQFTVNTTGYGNMTMSFCDRTDATTVNSFIVRVSSDGGDNWTTVLTTYTPATSNTTARTTGTFPTSANNQGEVLIQIYKTNNANNNARTYLIDNVTLNGSPIPTVTSFTPGTACVGTAITITGTNFTGATAVEVNGVVVSSFNVISPTSISAVIAAGNTTGLVTVSNANGSGSSATNLTVNPRPTSVTATPSSTSICTGSTINLTASAVSNSTTPGTILTQNFNAATNDWTKTNNSTGGTAASAAWTLRPNAYNYNFTGAINSNDASQFYFSNSDAQGTGGTTTTILQSPAFSTVNYASASLTFYHYFRYNTGETARVRVSTDGATWTTLETFTATVGTRNGFVQETYPLDDYLGQATVYVRFEYNATYDWYWAIDNVSVTGNAYVTPTYAWTSTPSGFTSALQNPTGVAPTVNTVYNLTVTNASGCTTTVSTASVNVSPTSFAGTVSANQNICTGTQPSNITIGSSTGTIQWQSSTDNITFGNISGQTANTLAGATIGTLTATRYYRAVVTSGVCSAVNSGVVTVTVSPTSVAGSVSSNQTICSGSQPGSITIGASTGTIQWQSSTDNITFGNISGQTTNTLAGATIGNLTATRYYRAVVTSGGCASVNSGVVTVTVNPTSVAGSVSSNQTICSGSQPVDITIGASTGTIQWQSSTDNITFGNISGQTANTLAGATIGNLTATRYYRAVVTSGGCASVNSGVVTVTVNPTSVAGSVSSNQTICSGSQPVDITIGASTGTIQWQSSTDNITFGNISGQTANTLAGATIGNLTATRYYRAVVTSGICSAVNSGVVTVTVSPTSVAGSVSANQTICSGSQPGNITIGASTGTIQWQSSTDNITFGNISGQTANTLAGATIGNLTATRYYRAVVTSGVCTAVNSGVVTVIVDPVSVAGAVSSSATVCAISNSGTLTLGVHTGNVIRWESSLDGFATAGTPIVNTTTSLNYNNLTATTSYRAVVQSGSCASANAVAATITVDPLTVAGTVSSSATVCATSNSGTLTLGVHTGNVIRWESSLDGFATAGTPIVNTTTTLNYNNLTATTSYRAVVQSGSCASANAVAATITVDPVSVGGTIAGSTIVCATSNSGSLNLSGYTGSIVKWQSSDLSDFSAAVLDIPNTSNTLSYVNLSGTIYYRAVIASGVCSTAFSSVATVIVDPAAVGGSVSGSTSVCYGNNSGSLNLSGYTGTISGWESSLDNFATAGTPIVNATAALNYNNLTVTTSYRAIISSGTCAPAASLSATVTVDDSTTWIGTNSTSWNDAGNWSCGVIPTTDVNVTITSVTNQPIVSTDSFAHTLTLQTGTTLTVQTGSALTIVDVIDGQGTSVLTVENDAHVIQVNDVNNNGNAVVKRDSNPLKRLDYILWSSPVTGSQTLLNFSPLTISTRFYVYNPGTNLYNSTATGNNFAEGKGYLIRMPDNHPTTATVWNGTFNGTLNNGDVDITVASNTYNAIGNPYPSSIDADAFIMQNNLSEALYFWRKTNNDLTTSYATYTLAGGVGTNPNNGGDLSLLVPDGTIQPGQGFIAKSTSAALSFNNGMRTGNNGQFFRNQIERNRIWLNLTNADGIFSQTMVSYMTGATNGLDAAIDGLYFNDSQLALNSMIDGTEYAIQGRALPFDNADVVPLGFKAIAAGTYTIGLDHADGLFADVAQDIFLKDNLDNSTHDLRAGNYTFAAEAGTVNNRFEIVYQATLAVTTPSWDANQVVVYKQGQDLVVNTGNQTMDNVKVFDIRGRLLVEKDNVNATETKLYAGTTNQVLIVKIISKDHREVTKKVIN